MVAQTEIVRINKLELSKNKKETADFSTVSFKKDYAVKIVYIILILPNLLQKRFKMISASIAVFDSMLSIFPFWCYNALINIRIL